MNDFSYVRYLLAKKSVDDRALNAHVVARLRAELTGRPLPLSVLELGSGVGTMVARLVEWGILSRARYTCVDADETSLRACREWLAEWAAARGHAHDMEGDALRITSENVDFTIRFLTRELDDYLDVASDGSADLLLANAFLDLVDVPQVLPRMLRLLSADGLYWFSINFDGETAFVPEANEDDALLRVYHRSMDERRRGDRRAGDSKTGRRLFQHLRDAGASILASGASDWVVHAVDGRYPEDEEYFVECILRTIDAELRKHAEVDPLLVGAWFARRLTELRSGDLVYIAHQLDFFGRR